MTISRTSINGGLALGAAMGFVALIGMLNVFEARFIIADVLALSTVMLAGVLLGAGLLAARRMTTQTPAALALNGALAGAVTILLMIGIVFVAQQINVWADGSGMSAIFPNVNDDLTRLLSLGQETPLVGYILMAALGALVGAAGGLSLLLPTQYMTTAAIIVTIIVALGMLQDQINAIISLADAIWITGLITIGYAVAAWRKRQPIWPRFVEPAVVGAALGLLGGLILVFAGAHEGTLPAFLGTPSPAILTSIVVGRGSLELLILLAFIGGVLGLVGGALSATTGTAHRLGTTVLVALLMLGVLNATRQITLVSALVITAMLVVQQLIAGRTAQQADTVYSGYGPRERRTSQTVIGLAGLAFVLLIPQLLSGYVNNVVDLIGLYVMMGLGLNIVVGFAGLLDLGYAAFFAIGAYMTGILTTPNVLTCGGLSPSTIPAAQIAATCTGMTTFWMAWPIAILTSGLAGVMLGIPVLRLRGDYLAIVTLGFGEIVRLVALSDVFKPYFGGAQGIVGIPAPTIDLSGFAGGLVNSGVPILTQIGQAFAEPISLSRPNEIYYLILAGVLLTAFVSSRLAGSRLGRAWRAMRSDEDVAQAMGIHLTRTKLLAFSFGAAFAGLGGALFGSYIKSIFPNSFTLVVSINVLSLIIIGGLGSIPGVMVGALAIFGLPEALREFQEFRLLMFGGLLVVMMILRPEGILPPTTPRLEERAEKAYAEEGT
jgi:branched-chain amino acid transport system permease protein